MPRTLYIIDSHSHLYASYYAIPHLRAPDGEPTGATFGFTQAVLKILRDKKPDFLVAVFDGPAETFRKKAFADYKIQRKPMPDDLQPQVPRVKEILHALGVADLDAPGYEADDLIARFTAEARADGCHVVIVSRDKDLMQLLAPGVVMFDNRRDETLDEAWLLAEKGLRPGQVADLLGLMGDAADNIPGVPGIGEKRAVALLQKFGSLDQVLARAAEIPGKMGESLRQSADVARLSRDLARLQPDIPVAVRYTDFSIRPSDDARLAALFRQLSFRALAEQFDKNPEPAAAESGAMAAAVRRHVSPETLFKEPDPTFSCLTTLPALETLAAQLLAAPAFAFDTEATGLDPLLSRLVGLSFSLQPGEAFYVPVLSPAPDSHLDAATVQRVLAPALANEKSLKVAHNAKFDLAVLDHAGFAVAGPLFDTMIASYLLDAADREHSLDALALKYLAYAGTPIENLIGPRPRGKNAAPQKTMDQIPLDQITPYACEDAELTWRLHEIFAPRLKADGLDDLFRNVEMPLVRVLEKMERTGVALDLSLLASLAETFGRRMEELQHEIYQLAGHEFNVDSPKQLGVVLFDEAGLKPLRKTAGGAARSTDSDTLEALAADHPLPAKVLEYRSLAKLKGTYVDSLPEMINPDTGRIHANFNQAVTATGRLSSSDPNLQNIPARTELGRGIRAAFVPGDRQRDVLLTADYSQVELRLLAHFSQDPFLQEAFHKDLDIHAFVAAELFGVPQEEVTGEQRGRAKVVNFSLIYGKSAYGLSRDLHISVGEARDYIDAYFARFTRVREFMTRVLEQAKRDAFVTTILGRRRPAPGVKHTDAQHWNNPERAAFNGVLQGSAADLIKVAMNNIDRRLVAENRPSQMILQVHDELVFEVPSASVEDESKFIVREMESAIKLDVPMKVDVAWGPNWREAK
jgi:DNA polymerase-1